MATVADKLMSIYDSKNQIRQAILHKGGALAEKAPLSDYPQAIYDLPVVTPSAPTQKYAPNPAWWDIKTILENDVPPSDDLVAVVAFLIPALESTYTNNSWWDGYRTSDGVTYTDNTKVHVWDTTKDKETGEGYSTRYVICYKKKSYAGWLGKLLTSKAMAESVYFPCSSLIGMVWNVPVFMTLSSANVYFITYAGGNIFRYPLCIASSKLSNNWNKVFFQLEYIDTTSNGKLVFMEFQAIRGSNEYFPPNLKYIAPIYHLLTVYQDSMPVGTQFTTSMGATHLFNNSNNKDIPTISNITSNAFCVSNLDIYLPSKLPYLNATADNDYAPLANWLPVGRTNTHGLGAATLNLHLVDIDTNISFYKGTIQKWLPIAPYTTSAISYGSDGASGIGCNLVVDNPSGADWYLFTPHLYMFNGMAASKLNDLLLTHFPARTSTTKLYFTASQYEKLSVSTKQTLAIRNYTLAQLTD